MKHSVAVVVCLAALTRPLLADSYLVLPFFNLSHDKNLEWIGESLSETVRDTLAGEGLIALDRDTREEGYRRLSLRPNTQLTKASILKMGEVLDADQIVYGTFDYTAPSSPADSRVKGTLKIDAQVISLKKARQGPELNEIGSLEDLARLEIHLAWQILVYASPKTAPTEDVFRSRRPVIRVDAIESYTRGLLAGTQEQKLKLLQQAVRLDPRFAQASYQLGKLYFDRKAWRPAAENLAKVQHTDAHYREAQFYIGLCRYRLGEFPASAEAFRLVAEEIPLNEVWNNLGAAELRLNQPDALANLKKALEGDPGDPDYQFNVGYALLRRGEFAAAAERFRAALERRPDDAEATAMLGRALRGVGNGGSGATPAATEGLERLKDSYEESAWLQLKAVFEPKRQ